MQVRFIKCIADISASEWNAIAGDNYPFLRHEFLHALEASGSVAAARGWQPQHLLVEQNGELMAVLPLYVKSHSYGEYVFDHSWAQAYQRHGLLYYPKLLSAIPFTPASGARLSHRCADLAALAKTVSEALQSHCKKLNASSWHCLFPVAEELPFWQAAGADVRLGCQYHWHNNQYASFDDFLSECISRKRKEMKRERAKVLESGIRLQRLTGDAITPEHWQHFYVFYQLTNAQYNGHTGYLTKDFFDRIYATMRGQLMLVLAYRDEKPIAGSLSFFSSDTLYGRYWGATEDVEFLHFEACYYQGLEFCIERGLQRFDPGAQGEHKIPRGFRPALTYSCHWIAHPQFREAIQHFLQEESEAVREYQKTASERLPFRG